MNEKGCPKCGRVVGAGERYCSYCHFDFNTIDDMFNKYKYQKKVYNPKYAGFIKRTVAMGMDMIIFSLLSIIFLLIYIYMIDPQIFIKIKILGIENIDWYNFVLSLNIWIFCLLYFIIYFFYCVFRQSSRKMGTIGEHLVGIEVVDKDGNTISFGKAFSRNLARILNIFTFGIGYLLIVFTKDKQALSDMVTSSYVVNKKTDEYTTKQYANVVGRFIAFIIDGAVLSLISFLAIKITPTIHDQIYNNLSSISLPIIGFLPDTIYLLYEIVVLIIIIGYFPIMESKFGSTIGKLILGIKVVDEKGNKIGFFKATIRYILIVLDNSIAFAPFLAFVSPKKQTLKDIITKTIVVDR